MKKIFVTTTVLVLTFIYAGTGYAWETQYDKVKRMAEHGMPMSQYMLGMMYENGEGVPRNVNESRRWYRKARDGGILMANARLDAINENDFLYRLGYSESQLEIFERLSAFPIQPVNYEAYNAWQKELNSPLRTTPSFTDTSSVSAKTDKKCAFDSNIMQSTFYTIYTLQLPHLIAKILF